LNISAKPRQQAKRRHIIYDMLFPQAINSPVKDDMRLPHAKNSRINNDVTFLHAINSHIKDDMMFPHVKNSHINNDMLFKRALKQILLKNATPYPFFCAILVLDIQYYHQFH
jgi:hypothetical protein